MVDLVKVRKKAKEKKEKASRESAPDTATQPQETPPAHVPLPVAPAPPPPTSAKEKKSNAEVSASAPHPTPAGAPSASVASSLVPGLSASGATPGAPLRSRIDSFLETANQRRTQRKDQVADSRPQLELLTFEIAGEQYAAAIENLVGIITTRRVTHVPNADPSIVGIISLRGTIVTLIDVRRRLGHSPLETARPDLGKKELSTIEDDARIIVVQQGSENAGFIVDRVLRVVPVDIDSIEPHPVVHASEQNDAVTGVFRHGESLTMLIDLERLLGGVVAWN